MSNIRTQFKGGSMTEEQKAYQNDKNEQDYKTGITKRFQFLENEINNLKTSLHLTDCDQQQHHVDSIHTVHELSDTYKSSLKELRLVMDDIQKQNKLLSDQYNSILNYVSNHYVTKLNYSNDYISDVDTHVKLKHEIAQNRNEFQALLARQKNELETRLEAFIHNANSKVDPTVDLKKSFDEKLELVSLNGQNSVLRSTNNEKHIHLIEKKLENIYQLIKQLQLDKQA